MNQNSDVITQLVQLNDADPAGNSWNKLAHRIGVSAATLTRLVHGKYDGDVDAIMRRIESFLKFEQAQKHAPKNVSFCETKNAKIVLDLCNYATAMHCMAMITGPAGVGKSIALKEFCKQHDNAIYIYINSTMHPKIFLSEIARRVKADYKVGINDLFVNVGEKLRGTNWVLLVDEAHKAGRQMLEIARELHDLADVGVLFSGSRMLYERITGLRRGKYDRDYDQIYSRLQRYHDLDYLEIEDTLMILQTVFPEADEKIAEYAHNIAGGVGRNLKNIVRLAQMSGNKKVTRAAIDDASAYVVLAA